MPAPDYSQAAVNPHIILPYLAREDEAGPYQYGQLYETEETWPNSEWLDARPQPAWATLVANKVDAYNWFFPYVPNNAELDARLITAETNIATLQAQVAAVILRVTALENPTP